MSKRLYVYSIILTVVYVIFLGHNLYDGSKEFASGFQEGWNQSKTHTQSSFYAGHLTPIKGFGTFPSKFINLKTGQEESFEIMSMMAKISKAPDSIPLYVQIMDVFKGLLSFVLVGLFIYVPFVVYRILKAVPRNTFYSIKNINRIRKLSFLLLGIYFSALLTNICSITSANAYMQIEGYQIVIQNFDYPLLFLGVIVLVLSEILRYTMSMKEEQELTI